MNEHVWRIVTQMRAAAPSGRAHLDEATMRRLRDLTGALIAARPDAAAEHARFLAIGDRRLGLPEEKLAARLRGATVLVTGGTGCVGSALLAQLAARSPGRLVSISRGSGGGQGGPGGPGGWSRQEGAEYLHADVRDRAALGAILAAVRPDVIFHVAAQRDPGLAETEVHRTVSTNVLGTRNVLAAAAAARVPQVVHASTGKALRPYSPEVYTASKRAAEWLAADAARTGAVLCSAARFTHVVDNSIVYRRLRAWAAAGGDTAAGDTADGDTAGGDTAVRLHAPDIAFYAQSAVESAQLLLAACAGAHPGELRVHAITDLGWPISLLDLALAVLAEHGSAAPVYFSGHDAGYEEVPFPGLYDPATAGDVSPLLNAFEAAVPCSSPARRTDAVRLEFAPDPRIGKLLAALELCCARTREPVLPRHVLGELSWTLLDATLRAAPPAALARSAMLAKAHWDAMSVEHRRVLEAICELAGRR